MNSLRILCFTCAKLLGECYIQGNSTCACMLIHMYTCCNGPKRTETAMNTKRIFTSNLMRWVHIHRFLHVTCMLYAHDMYLVLAFYHSPTCNTSTLYWTCTVHHITTFYNYTYISVHYVRDLNYARRIINNLARLSVLVCCNSHHNKI